MTSTLTAQPTGQRWLMPFPRPGIEVEIAYRDLERVSTARIPAEVADLPTIENLPRPWDITTCTDPVLRYQIWEWLDAVVDWINTQHLWEPTRHIPGCWPLHPHLVHDLSVVTDQRRTAGLATTSTLLDEWHRYTLPTFLDRLHTQLHDTCITTHKPHPGAHRISRYRTDHAQRIGWYLADANTPSG